MKINLLFTAIDTNIFLDLKNCRNHESLALRSDWLQSEINLFITREIFNEINRNEDENIKISSRAFAQNFFELTFFEDDFSKIYSELKRTIKPTTDSDRSDLKHLSYAISNEIEYFITRDEFLINNTKSFSNYSIKILRPSEFITHLDEILHSSKYKPQRLIGNNINSTKITSKNYENLISIFLGNNEKKSSLRDKIRTYLSLPQKFDLIAISQDKELISFVVFDKSNDRKLVIPIFRFLNNKLKTTLTKHLLFKAIYIATSEKRMFIEITENQLNNDTETIISESRFIKQNDTWQKICFFGTLTKNNALKKLNSLDEKSVIEKINSPHAMEMNQIKNDYNIERFLFPLKISDLKLSNFIIPIKPHWAEALFDDKSSQKIPFFEPNYTLLLNRENVYYRSASPKILKSPARVLWYVSENRHLQTKGHIRACSYLDAIFIDHPKKLYKKFEQLGVYNWQQVAKAAGNRDKVMAFVFSDTELCMNNVSIDFINSAFEMHENKKFMVVSPIEIKKETYIELYKKGMKL